MVVTNNISHPLKNVINLYLLKNIARQYFQAQ